MDEKFEKIRQFDVPILRVFDVSADSPDESLPEEKCRFLAVALPRSYFVWKKADLPAVETLIDLPGAASDTAISATAIVGQTLFLGFTEGSTIEVDLATSAQTHVPGITRSQVVSIFAQDSDTLVTVHDDGLVVLKTRSGQGIETRALSLPAQLAYAGPLSPERILAVTIDKNLLIVNLQLDLVEDSLEMGCFSLLTFSQTPDYLFIGCNYGYLTQVFLKDLRNRKLMLRRRKASSSMLTSIEPVLGGFLATGSDDGVLRLWATDRLESFKQISTGGSMVSSILSVGNQLWMVQLSGLILGLNLETIREFQAMHENAKAEFERIKQAEAEAARKNSKKNLKKKQK